MGANSDKQSSRACLIVAVTVHLRECRGRRLEIRPQLASNHTEGILKGTGSGSGLLFPIGLSMIYNKFKLILIIYSNFSVEMPNLVS